MILGLGNQANTGLAPFKNGLTETFGTVLYGMFHIASIVVLLNMLIAMMTKSYESILVRALKFFFLLILSSYAL
jgi:hypothetical protein